jgi:hypothetical protein
LFYCSKVMIVRYGSSKIVKNGDNKEKQKWIK